ncbi:MAG: hypothetical protein J7641_10010 [Cyanobacteria bacterium SID2]|nr:hypothetical protein [Cyanobacteria bacterium SID2]MBP0002106.1 hypothetical protein [Cyanobacteria bacterium SBC]
MTSEPQTPETPATSEDSAIVEVSDETRKIVKDEMPNLDEEIRAKVEELLEVVRRKAQAEVQAANDWTKDSYLKAIDNAKEAIEKTEQFAKEQQESLDNAVNLAQNEVQTRWDGLTKEIEDFGERLQEAAEAIWQIFTRPKVETPTATEESSDSEAADESK